MCVCICYRIILALLPLLLPSFDLSTGNFPDSLSFFEQRGEIEFSGEWLGRLLIRSGRNAAFNLIRYGGQVEIDESENRARSIENRFA